MVCVWVIAKIPVWYWCRVWKISSKQHSCRTQSLDNHDMAMWPALFVNTTRWHYSRARKLIYISLCTLSLWRNMHVRCCATSNVASVPCSRPCGDQWDVLISLYAISTFLICCLSLCVVATFPLVLVQNTSDCFDYNVSFKALVLIWYYM